MPLKIITLNVNGIRSAWRKGLADFLAREQADLVCLQETRVQHPQLTEEMLAPNLCQSFFHHATNVDVAAGCVKHQIDGITRIYIMQHVDETKRVSPINRHLIACEVTQELWLADLDIANKCLTLVLRRVHRCEHRRSYPIARGGCGAIGCGSFSSPFSLITWSWPTNLAAATNKIMATSLTSTIIDTRRDCQRL